MIRSIFLSNNDIMLDKETAYKYNIVLSIVLAIVIVLILKHIMNPIRIIDVNFVIDQK